MLSNKLKKYFAVGISVYLVELLIIYLAMLFGASTVIAIGISFWLGLILSFALQKVIAFDDKRSNPKVLMPQIIAYGGLVLFNFMFTIIVSALLQDTFTAALLRTITLAITTTWNYYLYKSHIFNINKNFID